MPNFNRVMFMGHLTRDFEVRHTTNGMAVAKSGLAVNTKRKNKDDDVLFIDITAFDRKAEALAEYTSKGDPLFVEGRLTLEKWQDKKTGDNRQKHSMIVDRFEFLKPKGDKGSSPPRNREPARAAEVDYNDLPF